MGARLTLVANLNELETSFFVSSSLSLFFFNHSTNKLQFLLVHGADLRDLCILRQSESLALEEVTSSIRNPTDERARQTITGQVRPLYPPRAGQRKWRNL